jgi:hypothetical protein
MPVIPAQAGMRGPLGRPVIIFAAAKSASRVRLLVQVLPGWIYPLDQLQIPTPLTRLDLLFARVRFDDVSTELAPDEARRSIFRNELRSLTGFAPPDSSRALVTPT